MNDHQHPNDVGDQIRSALATALSTSDFSNLNDLINKTVTDALDEAGKGMADGLKSKQPPKPIIQDSPAPFVKFTEVGSVSGILYQVFGWIGLGVSGAAALLRIPASIAGSAGPAGWILNLAALAVFFFMIRLGITERRRLTRARRYIQLCGSKMYCQIENLARDTNRSIRFVVKDIRRMLNLGMFPEGHLDDQKTCFMLNDMIHRQYLEMRNNHILQEKAAAEQKKLQAAGSASSANEENTEFNVMIAEGMECIGRLHELNDNIPGEVISQKLFRMEDLLKDIFNNVREHPEQMHRMHSMMDYYLPTTLKLVEAYRDFDKVSSPGEEIRSAKEEIERTLDIINHAFAELLDNLFQDAVFDATTDAQVLKTMLAREGLTENTEFK